MTRKFPPKPRGVQWDAEMDATLRQMRAKGAAWEGIAKRIGVSEATARYRAIALGVPTNSWPEGCRNRFQWTPEMDAEIRRVRAEGGSWTEVANKVGAEVKAVTRRGKALGLPTGHLSHGNRTDREMVQRAIEDNAA